MAHSQTDLFENGPAQPDMFAEHRPVPAYDPATYKPDLAVVRGRLHQWLADVRGCEAGSPWEDRETGSNITIFRQMANWLPEEERDQLRLEFVEELERLQIAA
jgi:hypothetical protein